MYDTVSAYACLSVRVLLSQIKYLLTFSAVGQI